MSLALDFIAKSGLLPDVTLKAYSRSLEVSSSGLDYILAGQDHVRTNNWGHRTECERLL